MVFIQGAGAPDPLVTESPQEGKQHENKYCKSFPFSGPSFGVDSKMVIPTRT